MHRDLKPQNIMLDSNYNIKVIDFGDAKEITDIRYQEVDEPKPDKKKKRADSDDMFGFDDEGENEQKLSKPYEEQETRFERTNTLVGTVNYLSPEVILGVEQTYAIDIWALGNIIFKMFTGGVPFKGKNANLVYKDIQDRKIDWPPPDRIDQMMSIEAFGLINSLI